MGELPATGSPGKVGKTNTSPVFDTPPPLSHGSKEDALVKVRLAHLQLGAQHKVLAHQAEFELPKRALAAETERALRLREQELNL